MTAMAEGSPLTADKLSDTAVSRVEELPDDLAIEAELTWASLMAEIEDASWNV